MIFRSTTSLLLGNLLEINSTFRKTHTHTQGENIQNLGLGKELLDLTSTRYIKGKNNKSEFSKILKFSSVKDCLEQEKKLIDWWRICAKHIILQRTKI